VAADRFAPVRGEESHLDGYADLAKDDLRMNVVDINE